MSSVRCAFGNVLNQRPLCQIFLQQQADSEFWMEDILQRAPVSYFSHKGTTDCCCWSLDQVERKPDRQRRRNKPTKTQIQHNIKICQCVCVCFFACLPVFVLLCVDLFVLTSVSIFNGPESNHCLPLSLTHWLILTHSLWLRFWSWCWVEILELKFDQDLCKKLWYDLKRLLW